MRKGKQKKLPSPGTNRKVWLSGALNWRTGRFHWVAGESKNSELFLKLLAERSLGGSTAATEACIWQRTTTRAIPVGE